MGGGNGIEVIADENGELWLNEGNIEEGLDCVCLRNTTKKYPSKCRKHRCEIVDEPKEQPHRIFIHDDLAIKIIMDSKTDESCNFKRRLGFKLYDVINTKQQTITKAIKEVFEREDIQTKYKVSGVNYRIDIYFHEYKIAVEIDEYGHCDRDIEYKKER